MGEKSVANLTWSYAAFLSAVRARTGTEVLVVNWIQELRQRTGGRK